MLGSKAAVKPGVEEKPKRSWSFRRKLLVGAIFVVAIIALAIGLGVGLTRGGDSDEDEDDSDNGGESDLPDSGPDRDRAWQPGVNTTWQIVLKYPIVVPSDGDFIPDVEAYDLDLMDNDMEVFDALHDADKKVICYFSAGSYEDWRSDKDDFDDADLGNDLDGWAGERWLDVTSDNVRNVMKKRINLAWRKGCDAIDPDNVDGYQNDNGLGLTSDDAIDFMRFLSEEAQEYKMSIGLKNAGDIIEDVLDFIDFSVNEQCIQFSECDTFAPFIEAGKPVFNIEYPDSAPDVSAQVANEICSTRGNATDTEGFSKVIKNMNLDGWVEYCNDETFDTETDN